MAGTLWGTRTAGQELCRAGAGALWARGPRCSRLGDWWTLRSSHLPCLLSTSQPSPPLLQPGGVTGTLNLEPHQSAQSKNFALRPLDAVTKRPGTVTLERPGLDTLICEGQGGEGGQGGRGARGEGALRRGIWNMTGTTWAGVYPLGTPGASDPPRLVLVYNSRAVSMSCIPRQKLFPRILALRAHWCLLRAGLL